jgi:hypothetical protein
MGEVYATVKMAKSEFPQSRLDLSGALRRRDVSWWRIVAPNDGYDWVAKTLGVTFVDPNSWIEDLDFGVDGLHINRRRARRLSQLYSRVCGFYVGGRKIIRSGALPMREKIAASDVELRVVVWIREFLLSRSTEPQLEDNYQRKLE